MLLCADLLIETNKPSYQFIKKRINQAINQEINQNTKKHINQAINQEIK